MLTGTLGSFLIPSRVTRPVFDQDFPSSPTPRHFVTLSFHAVSARHAAFTAVSLVSMYFGTASGLMFAVRECATFVSLFFNLAPTRPRYV